MPTKILILLKKRSITKWFKSSDRLNANKLTLNAKKSNFVIFRPYQRKMDHLVSIQIFDNSNHFLTSLECKNHVKYLAVLPGQSFELKIPHGQCSTRNK